MLLLDDIYLPERISIWFNINCILCVHVMLHVVNLSLKSYGTELTVTVTLILQTH